MKVIRWIGIVQIFMALGFVLLVPQLDQQIVKNLEEFSDPVERFSVIVTEHRQLYCEMEGSLARQEKGLREASNKITAAGNSLEVLGEVSQKAPSRFPLGGLPISDESLTETGSYFIGVGEVLTLFANKIHRYHDETCPRVTKALDKTSVKLSNVAKKMHHAKDKLHLCLVGVSVLAAMFLLLNGVAFLLVAKQLESKAKAEAKD